MAKYEVACDVRTFGNRGRLYPDQRHEITAKNDWDAVGQLREVMANELDVPTDGFGIRIHSVTPLQGVKRS